MSTDYFRLVGGGVLCSGGALVNVSLPGGAFVGGNTHGWNQNTKGAAWQYLDNTWEGTMATQFGGIKNVKLTDRSSVTPRAVQVSIAGANGTFSVGPADLPLQLDVGLGRAVSPRLGQCCETSFSPAACEFNTKGNTAACKTR